MLIKTAMLIIKFAFTVALQTERVLRNNTLLCSKKLAESIYFECGNSQCSWNCITELQELFKFYITKQNQWMDFDDIYFKLSVNSRITSFQ